MKELAQIYRKPDFWQVNQSRKEFLPFPGRYSTKWRIHYLVKDKNWTSILDYIGKPCGTVIQAVDHIRRPGMIAMYEFDRLGPFRYLDSMGPRKDGYLITQYNEWICRVYHPFGIYAKEFFVPWRYPLWIKTMLLDGRRWNFYSGYETVNKEEFQETLHEHRQWLRKNIQLK